MTRGWLLYSVLLVTGCAVCGLWAAWSWILVESAMQWLSRAWKAASVTDPDPPPCDTDWP